MQTYVQARTITREYAIHRFPKEFQHYSTAMPAEIEAAYRALTTDGGYLKNSKRTEGDEYGTGHVYELADGRVLWAKNPSLHHSSNGFRIYVFHNDESFRAYHYETAFDREAGIGRQPTRPKWTAVDAIAPKNA